MAVWHIHLFLPVMLPIYFFFFLSVKHFTGNSIINPLFYGCRSDTI